MGGYQVCLQNVLLTIQNDSSSVQESTYTRVYKVDIPLKAVFFNPGSAKPRGSINSLLGSLKKLLILVLRMFRFRQMIINVSQVP